ncbi:hypothetical protein, partial [Vibrio sp. S9_S30]|uniref:hypothetical protein n=1 Tax=Vibrio sp. S9_S30 TaxID=2720226 RepID=UPI0031386336
MVLKACSNLVCDSFSTLMLVEKSNSKALKPATFENLTILEFSKRYNASLNRKQRTNQAAALRLKHSNHRKLKMPRVVCRFEAFVRA